MAKIEEGTMVLPIAVAIGKINSGVFRLGMGYRLVLAPALPSKETHTKCGNQKQEWRKTDNFQWDGT